MGSSVSVRCLYYSGHSDFAFGLLDALTDEEEVYHSLECGVCYSTVRDFSLCFPGSKIQEHHTYRCELTAMSVASCSCLITNRA